MVFGNKWNWLWNSRVGRYCHVKMTDKSWNGAKKLLSPKNSESGLNITHDASCCSAFVPHCYTAERPKTSGNADVFTHVDFHLKNINSFSWGSVNKCYCKLFAYWCSAWNAVTEKQDPWRLLLLWFTAGLMSHRGHAGHRNSDNLAVSRVNF